MQSPNIHNTIAICRTGCPQVGPNLLDILILDKNGSVWYILYIKHTIDKVHLISITFFVVKIIFITINTWLIACPCAKTDGLIIFFIKPNFVLQDPTLRTTVFSRINRWLCKGKQLENFKHKDQDDFQYSLFVELFSTFAKKENTGFISI